MKPRLVATKLERSAHRVVALILWSMQATTTARWLQGAVRYLFIAVVVAIPLSVKFYFPGIDVEVIFPAEPLIALLGLVLFAMFLVKGARPRFRREALVHPITLLVAAYVGASVFAMLGSTMPMVSVKATLVRVCYVVVFYFYLVCMEHSDERVNLSRLLRFHGYAFLAIVLYSLVHQVSQGGGRVAAGLSPFPFYIDHTIYSAALVFVLFGFVYATYSSFSTVRWARPTILLLACGGLCAVALYFSFCRAAWLSALAALFFLFLHHLGLRFRGFVFAGLVLGSVLLFFRGPILNHARSNTVDSNADNAGFTESVLSITNINTDVSNTERLNRWSCAYRMFLDKPLLGFGPGTFQFEYMHYQRPGEITYVSAWDTRDPAKIQRTWSFSEQLFVRKNPQLHYYSGGTAHSEYLLALSEGGFLLFAVFLALGLMTLRTGIRSLAFYTDTSTRSMVLAALLGLLAYFAHGLFNNFLDDCKAAFLFWASLGVLTTLDVQRRTIERSPT